MVLEPKLCKERTRLLVEKIRLETSSSPPEALLLSQPESLLYFANLVPEPKSLNGKSISYLLIRQDGATTLFTDNWIGTPPNPVADELVVVDWYEGKKPAQDRWEVMGEVVARRLERIGAISIGTEIGFLPSLPVSSVKRLININNTIMSMREIKYPDEIKAIENSIRVAETLHKASRQHVKPGVREIDVYAAMVEEATCFLGHPFLMMCDLASGERAAQGGGPPTKRILGEKELVILDLFPLVDGYRADITNTLSVGGEPTGLQEEAFSFVQEALGAGEAALAPGARIEEIFGAMDEVFQQANKSWALEGHGGHGLGLGHPESPHIVRHSDRMLEENMVITLEPGVYDKSFDGIRLEHNYLITSDGFRRLSEHQLGLK